MELDKAIETLKKDIELCRFNPSTGEEVAMNADNEESAQAMEVAMNAMKKQIPKKPKIKYQQLHCLWCCDCGTYLGYKWDGFKYCPTCGQAIDWSKPS